MKESAVSLIPKEKLDYFKDDEEFTEFVINELTKQISERLIKVLEANDDIVIKKPVLKVSDFQPANNYVEYRKSVEWEPLVRCKDCKWFNDFGCAIRIVDESDKPRDDDFCSFGERRENE